MVFIVRTLGLLQGIAAAVKTSEVLETSEVSSESDECYYFRIGSGDDFAEEVEAFE